MRRLAVALVLLLPLALLAQQGPGTRIKLRFKDAKKGLQVDQDGSLTLDNSARRLVVVSRDRTHEVKYDDVQRILVEPDSHAGNIGFGAALVGFAAGGLLFGGRVATSIDNPLKASHVVYLEYSGEEGAVLPLVLVLSKDEAPQGLQRIRAAFGDLVHLPSFEESPERLDKNQFRVPGALQLRGNAQEHPFPESRADQALVVVASPLGGTFRPVETKKWTPFYAKIIVNGQVVTASAPGTYDFFYLDPGEYLLVSQAMVDKKVVDVTGLSIKVEAGGSYYLMHTIFISGGMKSFLTRHSKEIVLQEVADLLWSEWKPKGK